MALTSLIQGHFCLKFWLGALTKMTVYFFFCQIPLWCKGELPHPCGDPTKFALSGMPYIERRLALLIEVCTLILMWFLWLISLQIFVVNFGKIWYLFLWKYFLFGLRFSLSRFEIKFSNLVEGEDEKVLSSPNWHHWHVVVAFSVLVTEGSFCPEQVFTWNTFPVAIQSCMLNHIFD